jgi:hypothetical protein
MKPFILILFIAFFHSAFAEEAHVNLDGSLKESFQKYPVPTPEQILTAAFALKDSALEIVNQDHAPDCMKNHTEEVIKKIAKENTCLICAIFHKKDAKTYQLVLASPKADTKEKSSYMPNEITLSYEGLNDQPLHGALEDVKRIGNDVNGYTYGSKINATADYDWGSVSFDAGTDLYVHTYNVFPNDDKFYYVTSMGDKKAILQNADEHSYLRLNTKFNLSDAPYKDGVSTYLNPYLKAGLALEHDSDTGIGKWGGIYQREKWHQIFGSPPNKYIKHFQDQSETVVKAGGGLDSYKPIGPLGFCSVIEASLSAGTKGSIGVEGILKAALDSGTLGGASRRTPLMVLNLETGISNPLKKGRSPKAEENNNHFILPANSYPLIGQLKTSYSSIGTEIGSSHLRFEVEAIFLKNSLNDGDVIYRTALKAKF